MSDSCSAVNSKKGPVSLHAASSLNAFTYFHGVTDQNDAGSASMALTFSQDLMSPAISNEIIIVTMP